MIVKPYYQTLTDYGYLGTGNSNDPGTFDDACDAYADSLARGYDAVVFLITPPEAGMRDGRVEDVTHDVQDHLNARKGVH